MVVRSQLQYPQKAYVVQELGSASKCLSYTLVDAKYPPVTCQLSASLCPSETAETTQTKPKGNPKGKLKGETHKKPKGIPQTQSTGHRDPKAVRPAHVGGEPHGGVGACLPSAQGASAVRSTGDGSIRATEGGVSFGS